MSKTTENILIAAALTSVALALYSAYKATQTTAAANTPIANAAGEVGGYLSHAGDAVENWFSHLWGGSSSGGTPEATTGSTTN